MDHIENAEVTSSTVETVAGEMGHPRYNLEKERLVELLEINLSVDCIPKLLCVSASTVNRRMSFVSLPDRTTAMLLTRSLIMQSNASKMKCPQQAIGWSKGG